MKNDNPFPTEDTPIHEIERFRCKYNDCFGIIQIIYCKFFFNNYGTHLIQRKRYKPYSGGGIA